uniref:F-box protein At3g16210 family n=1 Tax=Cajanus cajan TaxID=3821 RepID=A0A151SYL8_CAJCA|nr:Putative F-box protein At3g16210 family [Cajanus cajan]
MDLSSLPCELILEIIVRLSAKCIAKYRCVCKSWQRLLSDRNFLEANYAALGSIRKPLFINEIVR